MRKHDGMLIFWPAYFDQNYSRSQGRKLPSKLSAPDVTLDLLKDAAESAGLDYELEPEKQYPKNWTESQGYIVVANDEGHKKKRLMLVLAKGVRRAAAQRESIRVAEEQRKDKKKGKK
ncbi:MAG: signal recognition particle subunit SRP19/SEC65 family protein, partial [Candidatus Thorarchaeota archaeon]|nr:signal recognition particle subunit SRP19/SEC65 family protein [Candidatus Thorarchaeota archaeon]